MRRIALVATTLWAALTLVACAGGEGPASGPAPASSAAKVRIVTESEANFHLWVSNQSFQDPTVVIKVSIDGVELIAQPFEVLGQHNWILFPISATAGDHVLDVVTGSDTKLSRTFTLAPAGRQYAVVNYWNDSGDDRPHFTWQIQATPVGFD